jgi:hypothetical protein
LEARFRSTEEVFNDHLELAYSGDVDTDVSRNFAHDCVLLTSIGVFRGHKGVREAAGLLFAELPNARYAYRTRLVHDEMAFLQWTAIADGVRVDDGADSFLIRDGLIQVMTFHYTVIPNP